MSICCIFFSCAIWEKDEKAQIVQVGKKKINKERLPAWLKNRAGIIKMKKSNVMYVCT